MKKLRTNEAAWLEKSGRWSIKVQRDGERKQFTSSKPGRKGKLEAERKADEWLEKGTVKEARFETAWANFLAAKRRECGSGWVDQLNSNGKTWLLPKLGLKKVSAITTQDWKDCILTAYEAGRNHKTLQNIRAAITGFVAYCEDAGIEIQPLRSLKVPNAPSNTRKILQPDELKTLFGQDTIRDYNRDKLCWYIYAWRLMVVTGLRRGELCGLRREDVENGRLYVRRSVTQNCEITQGKTKAAQRTMVITDHAQKNIGRSGRNAQGRRYSFALAFPRQRRQHERPQAHVQALGGIPPSAQYYGITARTAAYAYQPNAGCSAGQRPKAHGRPH